jgi:membrane protease YdiL (CAAX protease family)
MTRRLVAWILFVALFAGINYASRFTSGKPPRDFLYQWSSVASGLVLLAIILAVTLGIAGSQRQLFAWRRPPSWPRALLLALWSVPAYLAILSLDHVLHGGREQGLTPSHWEPRHASAYAANFVVIAIMTPFVEETLFRGLGYSLLERFGRWPAILAIGIVFGVAHGLVEALPELTLLGIVLAWLRSKTGSIYPGVLVHGTFNAIALIAAVTT